MANWNQDQAKREAKEKKYQPIITLALNRISKDPASVLRYFEAEDLKRGQMIDWDLNEFVEQLCEVANLRGLELYELGVKTFVPKVEKADPVKKARAAQKRKPAKKTGGGFNYNKFNARNAKKAKVAPKPKPPATASAKSSLPVSRASSASIDEDVLGLLDHDGQITCGLVIDELPNLSRDQASAALKRLVTSKKLVQIGQRRHAKYVRPDTIDKGKPQKDLFDSDARDDEEEDEGDGVAGGD